MRLLPIGISRKNRNILADENIRFTAYYARQNCDVILRKVTVWAPDKNREIVLMTNHLDFGSTTIFAVYKDRWQIELFFKAIKHNLRIKTFVRTSENALHIQIWTASIAMLLIKFLQLKSTFQWSLAGKDIFHASDIEVLKTRMHRIVMIDPFSGVEPMVMIVLPLLISHADLLGLKMIQRHLSCRFLLVFCHHFFGDFFARSVEIWHNSKMPPVFSPS